MKKKLKTLSQNSFIYLIFLFLIAILIKNNQTFFNIYKIAVSNYSERISKNYENIFYSGYCQNQSHGYLIHIKDNYEFDKVPEIINFQSDKKIPYWVFKKSNIEKSEKYLILLNYNQALKNSINFSNYKILDNFKNRCYFLIKND